MLTKQGRKVLNQATKLQIGWSNSISKRIGADKLKSVVQTMKNIGNRL